MLIGAGDDAAVLSAPDGRVVATTDMLIEDRHFRRAWSSPGDIGRKAAARNLADVAAMGAVPTALLVAFAGPGDLMADWVLELVDGIAAECATVGAAVAGGDTSSADTIMLAVTALGDLRGAAPGTRSGATADDVIAVTGTLGAAAAGLALLRAGIGRADAGQTPAEMAALVRAHQRPIPPYQAGPQAAVLGATSMIDVSDGLVADLSHLARASRVRLELHSSLVAAEPIAPVAALRAAGRAIGQPAWENWVLAGGDDHALVATFPPDVVLPPHWVPVGKVGAGEGVLIDGREWTAAGGWEHFRA